MKKQGLALFCAATLLSGMATAVQAQEAVQTPEPLPKTYADLISQYEEIYGAAAFEEREASNSMTGVCFLKLIDFDQDGTEELALAYNKEAEPFPSSVGEYVWEVWGYVDGQPSMLDSDSLYLTNDNAQSFYCTQYNGTWYVISGEDDAHTCHYYHGYGEAGFRIVRTALMDENTDGSTTYHIDGLPVSGEQWSTEEDAWLADTESYPMNYLEDASELLALCEQTKASLGMGSSGNAASPDADYILPNSSQEYLTREMLQGLDAKALQLARNEIFARHGRRFNTPELQQYFDSKSWYIPRYSPEEFEAIQYEELNEIEWANLDLISAAEAGVPASVPNNPSAQDVESAASNSPAQNAGSAAGSSPAQDVDSTAGNSSAQDVESAAGNSFAQDVESTAGNSSAQDVESAAGNSSAQDVKSTAGNSSAQDANSAPDSSAGQEQPGSSENASDVFRLLPESFTFSSGAGAWATVLELKEDGSFSGQYHDSDMGSIGDGYPNGTVYICNFNGKFSAPQKIGDSIYSMQLESLEAEGATDESYIEDGILYVNSEPYGMENANDFLIYLPGTPLSEIDEGFLNWLFLDPGLTALPDDVCGLYNVNAQHGFVGNF